jgi:hypothetical protein
MRGCSVVFLVCGALVGFTGCICIPKTYEGDGEFTDRCGKDFRVWGLMGLDRYRLDFGEVDLTTASVDSFNIGGLPRALRWSLGLSVTPRDDLPAGTKLDEAVVRVHMTNQDGEVVIEEEAPLNEWTWTLGGGAEKGVGPSWLYRSQSEKKADGGRGTSFDPNPDRRYRLTFEVVEPEADGQFFEVHLMLWGSNAVTL